MASTSALHHSSPLPMDLAPRKAELERLGFRVVSEDATSFVATRSKWHWECFFTKLTIVALVRRVPSVRGPDIDADEQYLHANASKLDPSALPPGFQKGRAFIAVYLTDHADPSAVQRVQKKPSLKFATFFMPALLDATGSSAWYQRTPIFGAIFYPILQFLIGRVVRPEGAPSEPPSKVGLIMSLAMIGIPLMLCPAFCLLTALAR